MAATEVADEAADGCDWGNLAAAAWLLPRLLMANAEATWPVVNRVG